MKKTLTSLASAAVFGFAVAYAPNASAAFSTYTSFENWSNAVFGNYVVENFEDTDIIPQISSISFASASGAIASGALNDIVLPNGANATVFNFAAPLTALGAYWDLTPGGAGVGLNLFADGVLVSLVEPTIDRTSSGQFFGFTTDIPFTALAIEGNGQSGVQETYRIPDMYITAVPIPAALPLFLSALVGLGVIGRRKQISSATA